VSTKSLIRLAPILALAHLSSFGAENSTTVLDLIRPGAATSGLIDPLGDPVSVEQREGLQVNTFTRPDSGIARATIWGDRDGTIQWARIQLVNELPPSAVRLLFTLVGAKTTSPGHAFADTEQEKGRTDHYEADGVHFFIVDGIVREIWRTRPRSDPAAIRIASRVRWPEPLPTRGPPAEMEEGTPGAYPGSRIETQLLWVGSIETGVVETSEGIAVQITGCMRARGMEGEKITIFGSFYGEDGKEPIQAAPTAPEKYRAPDGRFRIQDSGAIRHPDASWTNVALQLPLQHAEGYGNLFGRYVLKLEAFCGNKRGFCSGEVHLRLPETPPGRPDRRIRIDSELQLEEYTAEEEGAGFLVLIPMEAHSCRGSKLGCQVTLRKPDRTPVQASPGWDNWRGSRGIFYSLGFSEVQYDTSNWAPFRIFVPYAALDIPSGESPLVVRVLAFCENVATSLEFDCTIVKP